MENKSVKIIGDYKMQKGLYDECAIKVHSLLIDLLKSNSINVHQILSRVKNEKSLEEKLIKKEHKYRDISDVTDVIGMRIIAYFEDDIDKIAGIVEAEFDLDKINSVDKRELEDDRFGYKSLHYVFSLKKNRTRLAEYKKFAGLKVELQIRTILQHSWAEIEHDIGYKNEAGIPKSAKRTFFRVAALLETADLEFVKLKNILKDYESSVSASIQSNPENVLIDKASLESYINNSDILQEIDEEFSAFSDVPINGSASTTAQAVVERLINSGLTTIGELDKSIREKRDRIFNHHKERSIEQDGRRPVGMARGIALYRLSLVD